MWEYSDKVKEHFKNPRNVGEIENADAIGEAGALSCGDKLKLYLKINDKGIITDAKFQTFGCGSAVAASSILTEMIIGKSIDEAKKITNKQIADELDGLPPEKMHCSVMGREALEDALKKYEGEDWQDYAVEDKGSSPIICHCFSVSEQQIIDAVVKNGAKTVDDVSKITNAGLACGRCLGNIQKIIDKYVKKEDKTPLNPVQRIIKINTIIDTVIAPELRKDFGDIELVNVDGNSVFVKLKGHCSTCQNAKLTLKNFVETKLKELVDEDLIVIEG